MLRTIIALIVLLGGATASNGADTSRVTFSDPSADSLKILIDGKTVATYVWRDARIKRPFFKDVKTPGGIQVTRNHPPVAGQDPHDHADMHPGLWLAFADLGGRDFWRNKEPRIVQESLRVNRQGFDVVNHYMDDGQLLAVETARYIVFPRPSGYLLLWQTAIEPRIDGLYFGEPEEMGLGVRVASRIAVKGGNGRILNSIGGLNEKGTWGQQAQWCDYAGIIDGRHVGITIMADPANPRQPWFHSRDYGLMVANSFGQRAGMPAKWSLKKGEPLVMRFGVLVHESDTRVDPAREFPAFVGTGVLTKPAPPEPAGIMPIFDGKSLENWDGDPRLWSVRDGVIRGETTPEKAAKGNTFLIWKGGVVKDFELRLSFRINDTNNSGIQYRSEHVTGPDEKNKWAVKGYQAEVRVDDETPGFIYDERGTRRRMCLVGEKAIWENGQKTVVGSVGHPDAIRAAIKPDGWNDYVIIARGNYIQHFINAVQTIDFTDKDPQLARSEGILALQLHAGKPMWVEFKDIRLKHF